MLSGIKMKDKISIVLPVYNEERAVLKTVKSIQAVMNKTHYNYEVIAVNDGSTDNSKKILESISGIKVINQPYNIGYGAALKRGIRNAQGTYILMLDADGTYPVEDIPNLLRHIKDYEMVVGARTKKVHVPFMRRPAKFFLTILARILTGKKIQDLNSGFRVFKKDVAMKFFNLFPSGFSFTTTITLAYLSNDYTTKFVPINYYKRKGKSKIVAAEIFNFLLLIIRTITYFNPLKIFLPMGLILFILAIFLFAYSVFYLNKVMDISVIVFTLAAIQICFFGILADLISRKEAK